MTRRHLTGTERVEQLLRRRGDEGIDQSDFLGPETADGGPPITRLAARVAELRGRDVNVVTEGYRGGFAVYVLREERRVAVAPASEPDGQEMLPLDLPPRSATDPWDDGTP